MTIRKTRYDKKLGAWSWTSGLSNSFWIKKFARGIKLRKRGEGEINIDMHEASYLVSSLRRLPHINLIFPEELDIIFWKFPETRSFIGRLKDHKINEKEYEKLRKEFKESEEKKESILKGIRPK